MDRDRVRRLLSVDNTDDWERVLAAAAHLQRIAPDAVLVGGSAAAPYVEHRFSRAVAAALLAAFAPRS